MAARGREEGGAGVQPRPGFVSRPREGRLIQGTARRTFELWREGKSLPEIAEQRGLSSGTIATHLADLVLSGDIDGVSEWVDDLTLARIRKQANGQPIAALGPLKEALGEEVSYEQLHLARAYLNREQKQLLTSN
jgi:ATP-dependent DNA helicase RecQ